jgi:hypothetical protein
MNLAIRGHATRGREVIALLKMLGGENERFQLDGLNEKFIYYFCPEYSNDILSAIIPVGQIVFTLEEFEEKFPHKVGDKVIYENKKREITRMIWEVRTNTVAYKLDDKLYCNVINELQPYKEETFGESIEKTINECLFGGNEETMEGVYADNEINCYHQDFGDKVRIRLGNDFEIKVEDNKTYIVKKQPQYPKTYDECCSVLNIPNDEMHY